MPGLQPAGVLLLPLGTSARPAVSQTGVLLDGFQTAILHLPESAPAWKCTAPPPSSLLPTGWDLAVKLLRAKNSLNRGRLSCSGALRHPFLLLPA